MVSVLTRRGTIYCALLVLVLGIVWVLKPHVVVTKSNGRKGLIRDALVSYEAENGRLADSFVEVEPYLEILTRTDCLITQEGKDNYKVEMPLSDGKTYYMGVTYAVDSDGKWERFDVRSTGSKRTR